MLNFEDYDMVSDLIDWLGHSIQYKFIVKLASKEKDGTRSSFHREYSYKSSYSDVDMVNSIKRSFDYYITLESLNKETYIQIRPQNMIMIQNVLNQVYMWLMNDSLWAIKNKALVVKGKPAPLVISNLPMGKWISFELISIEYNGQYDKGVRIGLSDESQYTDVRIDQFMGFVYFMSSINMYQAALEIINYVQRPAFGTNMVTFDNNQGTYNKPSNYNEGDAYARGNRTIVPPTQQKSFFDKVKSIS